MREHGHRHHQESMISVEEALERILGFFHVLEPEEKPILDALGQVLAEDVVSHFDIPPLDNSAMDGYAVRAGSLKDATELSPVLLRVIERRSWPAGGSGGVPRSATNMRPSDARALTLSEGGFYT